MRVYDSDRTDRGTVRKKIYITGCEFNREAQAQAMKDINAEKRSRPIEKPVKPYKQMPYKVYPCNQNLLAREEKEKLKQLRNEQD